MPRSETWKNGVMLDFVETPDDPMVAERAAVAEINRKVLVGEINIADAKATEGVELAKLVKPKKK